VYIIEVLREYLGRSVVAYIDDNLVYSSSRDQHMHDVRAVLHTLLQNHLYCKLEKCEFHHKEYGGVRLRWGPEVERSLSELKKAFSTAPVLQQPDPEKPFVVEARREEHEGGCSLSATPRRSPVYQRGASTVTHLFPGNSELGPGQTDGGTKSASAMPAKPPLSHSASIKPLSHEHTPPWGLATQEQPAWRSF
ncbi:hypothetical protein P4O66_005526, partial [Electrophorus voltai]